MKIYEKTHNYGYIIWMVVKYSGLYYIIDFRIRVEVPYINQVFV